MPKPHRVQESERELRLLEKVGLVPPPVLTDALAVLRAQAAGDRLYRWQFRGRVRLAVFDPVLAAEVACPRVQALSVPPPHGARERRWVSSFLAESPRGGGPRTFRLSEAVERVWNDPQQGGAREALRERLLVGYEPGSVRPLGRDLRDHALRLALLWTEGNENEEAVRVLANAVYGDETAAGSYGRRLASLSAEGRRGGVLFRFGEPGASDPEFLADVALFAELVARVLGDLLGAVGRSLCDERTDGADPSFIDRVLRSDPPWWIHVRETVHEYRLGIERVPPGAKIFVPVALLAEDGAVPRAAAGHPLALALGANLCPPLRMLADEARRLAVALGAQGRFEPLESACFAVSDGRYVPEAMAVHVVRRERGSDRTGTSGPREPSLLE
jgi:hypothetical protein